MPHSFNSSATAMGSGNLLNPTHKLRSFAGGHVAGVGQRMGNSSETAVGSKNLLNPRPMLNGFAGGSIPGVGQRLANASAAGRTEADQPKLLLYCAGLVSAVPSLIVLKAAAANDVRRPPRRRACGTALSLPTDDWGDD